MNALALRQAAKKDEPQTENQLQAEIVRELRKLGLFVVAIPNGGKRRPKEAQQLRNRGVVKGFPDLAVLRNDRDITFLELKTDEGKLQPEQIIVGMTLRTLGFPVHVVRSLDEALKVFA